MKRGHLFWAKYREVGEVIGLQALFNLYWSSNHRDFTVLSQWLSPTGPRILLIERDRDYCHWKA